MKRILVINILVTVILSAGIGIGGWLLGTTHAQDDSSVILACVDSLTGTVRIVTSQSECKPSETGTQWNVQGPPGPQGQPGPQGERGEQGPAGSSGGAEITALSGYEIVSEEVQMIPTVDYYTVDDYERIDCPAGKTVIGGGYRLLTLSDEVEVVLSYPYENSWVVGVNTDREIGMRMYAVCAYVQN